MEGAELGFEKTNPIGRVWWEIRFEGQSLRGSLRGILQLEPNFAKRKRRDGELLRGRIARIGDLKKQTQTLERTPVGWPARDSGICKNEANFIWGPFFQLAEREKAPKTEMARRL